MKICVKKEVPCQSFFKKGNLYKGISSGGILYIATGPDELVALSTGGLASYYNHSNFIDVTDQYCLTEI